MFQVVLELAASFVQYFILIVQIPDINFPESWKDPMRYVSVINLNFDFLRTYFPDLSDLRFYFIVVSIMLPMLFIIIGLLFLNPKRVVLWYLCLVLGVMLLVAGAFGRIITETTSLEISEDLSNRFMIIGGIVVAVCMVLYFIARSGKVACLASDESQATERKAVIEEETRHIKLFSLLVNIFLIVMFFAAFVLLTGVAGFTTIKDELDYMVARGFSLGLGITCGVVCLMILGWSIMHCSLEGRRKQWEVLQWLEASFLRVFLVSLSLAYIPIGSGCFYMFNCNSFTCPSGTRLPDQDSVVRANYTVAGTPSYCVPCVKLAAQTCSIYAKVCAEMTQERLEYDKSLQCGGMRAFFWPAAILIIIMFVLGVPWMFFRLIRYSSTSLNEEFPIKVHEGQEDDQNIIWGLKIHQSELVAKFLFEPFEYEYRYTRLFQIVQKLLIVVCSVYIIRGGSVEPQWISLIASCVIHFISTLLLMKFKPFISDFEDKMAIVMAAFLTLSTVAGILLLSGVDLPNWLWIIIIIANGVLPIIAIVIGIILEYSRGKDVEEEEQKEKMKRLSAELQKKEDEEMAIQMQADENAAVVDVYPPGAVPQHGYSPASRSPEPGAASGRGRSPQPTLREQAERRRQLAAQARAEVEEQINKELVELHEKQGDCDLNLNKSVKTMLNTFLMIAGLLAFLAMACSLLGMTVSIDKPTYDPFPRQHTIETEYAGYTSWNNFTSHCCCTYMQNKEGYFIHSVEKWICENDKVKERARETDDASGFAVRGLCGLTFNGGCTPTSTGEIGILCPFSAPFSEDEKKLW